MKVKKSEIQLLIAVLGVLLAVVTYFLVYAKFNDMSETIETQNASLRSQVSTLEILEQRKADYLEATERCSHILPDSRIVFRQIFTGRQHHDGEDVRGLYSHGRSEYRIWNRGRGTVCSRNSGCNRWNSGCNRRNSGCIRCGCHS